VWKLARHRRAEADAKSLAWRWKERPESHRLGARSPRHGTPVVVRNVDDQADIIAAELGTQERETWVRLGAM
jgi:hypothetical protein